MHLYQSLKTATCIQSRSKPSFHVEIDIGGHTESKIYTTGSKIQGSVKLTAHHQTAFHSVQVDFRGTTTTRQAFQYGTPFTTHTFMQIRMPISEAVLPACQILEAGKVYNIPFLFIIPTDLSPKACNHQNTTVRERHLLLPPTIGAWKTKDLTDGSISVDYVIRARLVLEKDDRGKERFVDHDMSLKVIPVYPEQPPIHISSPNSQYCLSQTKTIRRNLLCGKAGILRVSTAQPRSMTLYLDHLQVSESRLAIDLEYIGTSPRSMPPEIRIKTAAIEAMTSFWPGPIGHLPDHCEALSNSTSPVAPWSSSHPLLLQGVEQVNWEKETDIDTSLKSFNKDFDQSGPYIHKATIIQSFELPGKKLFFLPTFHSCMISRTYRVHFTLTTSAGGTRLSLVVPLQIASGVSSSDQDTALPVYVSAIVITIERQKI